MVSEYPSVEYKRQKPSFVCCSRRSSCDHSARRPMLVRWQRQGWLTCVSGLGGNWFTFLPPQSNRGGRCHNDHVHFLTLNDTQERKDSLLWPWSPLLRAPSTLLPIIDIVLTEISLCSVPYVTKPMHSNYNTDWCITRWKRPHATRTVCWFVSKRRRGLLSDCSAQNRLVSHWRCLVNPDVWSGQV